MLAWLGELECVQLYVSRGEMSDTSAGDGASSEKVTHERGDFQLPDHASTQPNISTANQMNDEDDEITVTKAKLQKKRKRGRSVGRDGDISPELIAEIKAATTNKRKSQETNTKKKSKFNEDCVFCTLPGTRGNMIQCEQCEQFYHLLCCSIPVAKHAAMQEAITLLGWTCKVCRSQLFETIDKLKKQVEDLQTTLTLNKVEKDSNDQIIEKLQKDVGEIQTTANVKRTTIDMVGPADQEQEANHCVQKDSNLNEDNSQPRKNITNDGTIGALSYAEVLKVVTNTVQDVHRRKKNIIISGLSDNNPTKDSDMEMVEDLLNYELSMDTRNKLISCRRLGSTEVGKIRRLLVVLDSEISVSEIMHRAHFLTNSNTLQDISILTGI